MMKIKIGIVFILWVFIIVGPLNAQFFNEQGLKFVTLFNWLENQYVDSLDLEKLSDNAIRELLQKLDPHSIYLTKEEVAEMNEPLQGNFDGIGVTFNIYKDTILILSCIQGGPSEKLGILAGDRIIKIENENVAGVGITRKDVMIKLRGKKGTPVKVHILRRDIKDLMPFTIIRDKIPIESIDASYKIDKKTGYIRLSRFSATTVREISSTCKSFKDAGIKNIIIDLSGNGGGYLDMAVSLADEFLPSGKRIVYTQGSHSRIKEEFSTKAGLFDKGKLVVIIDEYSASASEIFAGAIQDWDRGIIIGRRSFGKGLVQRMFTFPDGSGIRLTVARYYTPSGRLIQKSYSNGLKAYSGELSNRAKTGEIFGKDQADSQDSIKYYTLIKNRIVYGGGGITPDVYVPVDTINFTSLYRQILSKGLINSFVLDYIEKNRKYLNHQYPSFAKFKSGFSVDEAMLDCFSSYIAEKKISFKPDEYQKINKMLTVVIKANMALDLWTLNEFYEVYNEIDPDFIKAKEIIKNWKN